MHVAARVCCQRQLLVRRCKMFSVANQFRIRGERHRACDAGSEPRKTIISRSVSVELPATANSALGVPSGSDPALRDFQPVLFQRHEIPFTKAGCVVVLLFCRAGAGSMMWQSRSGSICCGDVSLCKTTAVIQRLRAMSGINATRTLFPTAGVPVFALQHWTIHSFIHWSSGSGARSIYSLFA